MQTQKMSLANIIGKLSRDEMKKIMAGSGGVDTSKCNVYCGTGTSVTCSGFCSSCEPSGNAYNPNIVGSDKICA